MVYLLGYALIAVQDRYLYGAWIVLWVCLLHALLPLWRESRALILLLCMTATLIAEPRLRAYAALKPDISNAVVARDLENLVPYGARIASIGGWHYTLAIAYASHYQYFGEMGTVISPETFARQLRLAHIEYLFYYPGEPLIPLVLTSGASKIYQNDNLLIVYRLPRQ
jgi:hypothetical protein